MKICQKCGNKLQEDAAFCGVCGASVGNNVNSEDGVPAFTSPEKSIPKFTPPKDAVPTFQPPKGGEHHDEAVCFHHPSEPAAGRCARCGKYICKDCVEAYGVSAGEYAGKCLCFDCCQELVAQNVEELKRNKKVIRNQFILQIIGMVIGFIFGMFYGIGSGGVGIGIFAGLVYACIGGVFLSALKAFFSLTWDAIKVALSGNFGLMTVLSIMWNTIVIVFKCIWVTLSNTVQYIIYLKKTSGFIEEDTAALQQMRDYMEYTLVRNQNKGVDLESLMDEGSQLYNNSYAQAVRDNGEQVADAALRQATTRIAENGEIIRDFPNANRAAA